MATDNGNGHKAPDIIQVTIPVGVNFPMSMFLPTGALEHRIHRSKFLKQILSVDAWCSLYDQYAEVARVELNKRDPRTLRPPLEQLGTVVIDVSAISKAAQPDMEEEVAEEDKKDDGLPS